MLLLSAADNPFSLKRCSVNLRKFDAEWETKPSQFETHYSCTKCKIILQKEKDFREHRKGCRVLLVCRHCHGIKTKQSFLRHTNAKPIECPTCKIEFKCLTLWKDHKQEHHQDGFSCELCTYIGKSKDKFDNHFKFHARKWSCESCGGTFGRKQELKHHQMQHKHGPYSNIDVSFGCDQCGKAFRTPDGLRLHKIYSHQSRSLECDVCGRNLKGKGNMTKHLGTHIKEECKMCGEMVTKIRMEEHVNREHVKSERAKICENCGKRFLDNQKFNRHLSSKPIDCPSCQISFKCRDLWLQHKKDQHQEGFSCNQCSYVRKEIRKFRAHLRSHRKDFSCDSCPKKFSSKTLLAYHQKNRLHGVYARVRIEAVQCDKCEKSFRSKRDLQIHKQTHEFRNVKCDICNKTLNGRISLIGHFRTHIVEECEFCAKKFTISKMPQHLLREHNKADRLLPVKSK